MTCSDPTHFAELDGALSPQPWMQWRNVATAVAASKSGSYPVAGGGNRNDLLQTVQARWKNNTPIDQYAYGIVSRGGCRVALQARSRGGLVRAPSAGAVRSVVMPTQSIPRRPQPPCRPPRQSRPPPSRSKFEAS